MIFLPLNGYILKNIFPNYINNVCKFSDELLSMYKFWENFGKIYIQILRKKFWKKKLQ